MHPLGKFQDFTVPSVKEGTSEFKEHVEQDVSMPSMKEEPLPDHPVPPVPLPELFPPIAAQTYIFCRENRLEAGLWSYKDFIRDNAQNWY